MTEKENVDVKNNQTEEAAALRAPLEGEERTASTVLGKFKDVNALEKAYEALQAEFTRRSQKLRALEKEVDNLRALSDAGSGAEKLRKTAEARREAAKAFDKFVAEVGNPAERKPAEEERSEEINEADTQPTATEKQGDEPVGELLNGGVGERLPSEESKEKLSASEALYRKAIGDDEVRLRIVGEYLASLRKPAPPLTGVGTGVLATPAARAKTVGQAGDMALLYFRKPRLE